ncbi:hypothetical protein IFM89_026928 [Coptis chinensis]|uniref:Non-specific lipid-transfer protein n=1 Tax=Coptis chinensis TaxID=261450 RepID=A0A835LBU2_9MAGN|nr:hypothetical protein IFM89_026928 [Coptis chinensis]
MKVAVCVALVLAMIQVMVSPGQAFTCVDVDKCLMQCIPFLTGGANEPGDSCCAGVKQIKGMAVSTDEKRQACTCAKQAAIHYQNIKDDAVGALPTKCGTPLSFPITKNINCDMIS